MADLSSPSVWALAHACERARAYSGLLKANSIIKTLHSAGFVIERGWQSIETAPKDGEFVLLYYPHVRNLPGVVVRSTYNETVEWDALLGGINRSPSYWKPLPEPPK